MNDIFISYEHQSKSIADNIVAKLEQNKIRCWYAPRDVIGDYATSIVEAINHSKIFVLVLNENSSKSPHCLNEVEIAYKANIENKTNITILPFRVDNKNLSMAMEYYVKRLHWIDAANCSLDKAITELYNKVKVILHIEDKPEDNKSKERVSNKYFSSDDSKEKKRLKIQQSLLKNFDSAMYDKLIAGKNNLKVLDIGSNNGDLIMDRLGKKEAVELIIGLECEENAVIEANTKYADCNAKFVQCDIESEELEETLDSILIENKIESFDVLHFSMVFLHLKNPFKVLKTLRKHINPNTVLFVKDIDDGLNFAFPDQDGVIERIYKICELNDTSGYRKSGRQIFTYLTNSGFKNISLERMGLNSIGMSYDEKQALFDTYFSFIREDLKIMKDRYPDNERIAEDYKWYLEIYDSLEEKFHNPDFVFNLGFMIYLAHAE